MSEVQFAPGDLVFSEGSPSDSVLRILSGEAEVLKVVDSTEVVLGRLSAGDYAGEMGVIEGRPRGATVRALTAVSAERYGREAFLARVSRDSQLAFKMLVRLSERLNALDESFAAARAAQEPRPSSLRSRVTAAPARPAPSPAPAPRTTGADARLSLRADSQILAAVLPMPEIPVESLPYTVGRTPGPGEASARERVDLMLDDARPYRLSRAHFRIERGNGGYLVRDLGSVLGTTVNRRPIGQHFADDAAPLQPGDNSILAGGEESPFRFRLSLRGT